VSLYDLIARSEEASLSTVSDRFTPSSLPAISVIHLHHCGCFHGSF
jgi:hypothetical protein